MMSVYINYILYFSSVSLLSLSIYLSLSCDYRVRCLLVGGLVLGGWGWARGRPRASTTEPTTTRDSPRHSLL